LLPFLQVPCGQRENSTQAYNAENEKRRNAMQEIKLKREVGWAGYNKSKRERGKRKGGCGGITCKQNEKRKKCRCATQVTHCKSLG
jgi:hypothetical protein